MTINQDTINLIKSYEGLVLQAYPDPATGDEPWTIGYGTTIYPNGVKVKTGDIITKAQAESFLVSDITKFAIKVASLLKKNLTDNQFGAIVSFTYNVGLGNLKISTLLKKVNINPNDTSIANEFPKWNKANGKVMLGLTRRRKAENDLYFKS